MTPPTEQLSDLLPTTPDGREERLAELRRLFPDLFTNEGRLDPRELNRLVEPEAANETERYEFKWYGKAASKREAFTPTTATLVYDEARSMNPEKADGNLIIEGENLEVLKLLLNAYREKVKCIYIDPPYNTGKDFIYRDNYAKDRKRYWEETGETVDGVKLETNPETSGRYHSDWLSFMNSRLLVARQMLKDDGVILISIDDHEVTNLRRLADEVLGGENFVTTLVWEKGRKNDAKLFSIGHEYILVYGKDLAKLKERKVVWREEKPGALEIWEEYVRLRGIFGKDNEAVEKALSEWFATLPRTHPSKKLQRYRRVDEHGPWRDRDISWPGGSGPTYDVIHPVTKQACAVPPDGWRFANPEEMDRQIRIGVVAFRADHTEPPFRKAHLKPLPEEFDTGDAADEESEDEEEDVELAQQVRGTYFYKQSQPSVKHLREVFDGQKVFPNPKDTEEIARLVSYVIGSSNSDVVLDFFGGSGTLAEAMLRINESQNTSHRFIVVQIPESVNESKREGKAALRLGLPTISSLTIERVKRVIQGYGSDPKPIPETGFKVYRLQKSNFPRCEFRPDPDLDEAANVAALRHYIDEKEAAHLAFLDGEAERAVFDEVLLKNGFRLDWTRERRDDFPKNTVYRVSDGEREALVCLAWSERLHESTLRRLRELAESGDLPFFICLERSLDTTAKWNLKHLLGKHLVAF